MSGNGLIAIRSAHPARETIDRLAAALEAKGVRIFARIDHGAGAAEAGMALRPTELLIFGHPKSGTPLMQSRQSAGIDLPLKALAWEDADGQTWLAYNDMGWLAARHGIEGAAMAAVEAIGALLASLAGAATS